MRLVIGLGNPGSQYQNTRHNTGFIAADKLSETLGVSFTRSLNNALVARAFYAGVSALIIKPQTFMNASGRSVAPIAHRYGCSPEDILVLVDDFYLPLGTVRLRRAGNAGGHKGLMSIAAELGSVQFPRLRMGIGVERIPGNDFTAFVLSRFTAEELATVGTMTDRAVNACLCWLEQGIEEAMKRFNERGLEKGK